MKNPYPFERRRTFLAKGKAAPGIEGGLGKGVREEVPFAQAESIAKAALRQGPTKTSPDHTSPANTSALGVA
jgi:hypothetical protein